MADSISPADIRKAEAHAPKAVGANASTTGQPWQKTSDPVKALHHVVQHLTNSTSKPLTEKVKLDLGAALTPLLKPYQKAISSENAAGAATAGPGASKELQQASTAAPDLSQYLGQINQGLAADPGLGGGQGLEQALTSGLANVGQANQSMPGAIAEQGAQSGNAGLLADLLNAAKYQAIYRQTAYGTAPNAQTNPALAQLYASVVAGGGALAPSTQLPTSITSPKTQPATPNSPINAGSANSPFG